MRKAALFVLFIAIGAFGAIAIRNSNLKFSLTISNEREKPQPEPARTTPGPIEEVVQRNTAVHEAGHAIANAVTRPRSGIRLIEVRTEMDEGGGYGYVYHEDVNRAETKEEVLSDIVEDLAGRSADEIVNGAADTGGAQDLENATESVIRMCGQSGMCGALVYKDGLPEETIERCLRLMKSRADMLVNANKHVIIELADHLMTQPVKNGKRTLTKEGYRAFLKDRRLLTEDDLGYTPPTCE